MGREVLGSASLLVAIAMSVPAMSAKPANSVNVPVMVLKSAAEPRPVQPHLSGIATLAPDAGTEEADRTVGELVTDRYRDGKVNTERRVIQDSAGNYVNHGPYTQLDPQGKIARTGAFLKGKQHGKWTHSIAEDEDYLFSRINEKGFAGPFLSEANFIGGQLDGVWTIKDAKNLPVVEWSFEHDVANGKWIWWYSNGQKRLEANYRDGKLNGDMKEFDRDGKLTLDRTYVDGKWRDKVVGWHAPGQKAYEGYYLRAAAIPEPKYKYNWWTATATASDEPSGEDERHGRWVSWHPNGNKKAEWSYDHGVLIGRIAWWYDNGQKQAEGNYDAGQKAGTWVTWHPNGLKESEGRFEADQLAGRYAHWDENGKLVEPGKSLEGGAQMQNTAESGPASPGEL